MMFDGCYAPSSRACHENWHARAAHEGTKGGSGPQPQKLQHLNRGSGESWPSQSNAVQQKV
eukprot:580032-Amphidinium_carterae.1